MLQLRSLLFGLIVLSIITTVIGQAPKTKDSTPSNIPGTVAKGDRRTRENEAFLNRRIPIFEVRNAPISRIIEALDWIGVGACLEEPETANRSYYLDDAGVGVFRADRIFSFRCADCSVSELLDRIVTVEPRLSWHQVPKSNLINIRPAKSQFAFHVGPIDASGNPAEILLRIGLQKMEWKRLLPKSGISDFPSVSVNVSEIPALELLNHIAAQHNGMTWHFYDNHTYLRYVPNPLAEGVELIYPDVRPGARSQSREKYELFVSDAEQGIRRLRVKKVKPQ